MSGPGTRRRAKRGQGELLRAEILVAAEQLLIQTGDQGAVSVRAIADAAGVTPPSIYLHFADKSELLMAVCEARFTDFLRYLDDAIGGIDDPHAKDPRTRVDVVPSERHLRVEIAGELVAESRRPHALFETTLPTRWYLPAEDVRQDLLEPSDTVTKCPYKGTARYWSVRAGGRLHPDAAWSYPDPIPENPRIAGLIAFFNEKVNLTIDGEREARPVTPWSE